METPLSISQDLFGGEQFPPFLERLASASGGNGRASCLRTGRYISKLPGRHDWRGLFRAAVGQVVNLRRVLYPPPGRLANARPPQDAIPPQVRTWSTNCL